MTAPGPGGGSGGGVNDGLLRREFSVGVPGDLGASPIAEERLPGSDRPVRYYLAETMDGLYTPYALRTPSDSGTFPFVFIGYGNGGGGLEWLRDRVRSFDHIQERLLAAGYACAWGRYRAEVELGYHRGGPLVRDRRQLMDLFNRAPLEFEDEVAILDHVRGLPGIDPARIGHIGVSHAGEMLFKIASAFPGAITAGVACEPANHEFLDLDTSSESVRVNPETGLRDIEEMQMQSPAFVRGRINEDLVRERVEPIETPILVMGRDDDHLQGIFRVSYDVLAEAGKDATWVSWPHDLHGYIYPLRTPEGHLQLDRTQTEAIDGIITFLDTHLKP